MRLCECVSCAVWFGLVWFARATRGGLWLLAVGISRAARDDGRFFAVACVRACARETGAVDSKDCYGTRTGARRRRRDALRGGVGSAVRLRHGHGS